MEFQGWSLCSALQDFYLHDECLPDASYLWPALQLRAEDLWELTDVTPFEATKPMSRARFLELLRGALAEMCTPHAESSSAAYNRFRRFMPTLGNCLDAGVGKLGGDPLWRRTPTNVQRESGDGYGPTLRWGQKVFIAAQIKRAILARFFTLHKRKASELALTVDGLLTPTAWTWPELCTMNAGLGEVKLDMVEIVDDDTAAANEEDVAPADLPIRHTSLRLSPKLRCQQLQPRMWWNLRMANIHRHQHLMYRLWQRSWRASWLSRPPIPT